MSRIVSFLPAGTEIVYALGAGAELVGRSHECDFPPEATALPVVSRPALQLDGLSQEEVDRAVAAKLGAGESLYEVDERLLQSLAPDVVVTQDLCQVCAPSGTELSRALRELPSQPDVLWLTPQTIADIEENIRAVGRATGRSDAAEQIIAAQHARIDRVEHAVAGAPIRRVAFLEWTDPLFCAGHWVPEMIAAAGGHDPLGRSGADSQRMEWDDVLESKPEIVVVSPCGYHLERALELAATLPHVNGARIVAVDANAYFARPGPRVAEGIELLAHLFHPDRFAWDHPSRPWRELSPRPSTSP
jgi:iron complex transport system substrate-binding protein